MAAVFIRIFQHSQELALLVFVIRKQQEDHSIKQRWVRCHYRENTASVPVRLLVRVQNGEAGLSREAAKWAKAHSGRASAVG